MTNSLTKRSYQHKEKVDKKSFTAKYNVDKVVYYEVFGDVYAAITREKQLKNLVRRKKIALINSFNPEWRDLVEQIF